ncbi:YfhO family protein [Butyrivibrio sp. AE3006]|uniref:YfhO family protein n=1 Tax=Butyrivibrio sp. AE3006 TaxID=1280673 RepID=UPI0003FC571E|nr:YfhO family protein [Butyrivibrio sp. AE3006]
MKREKELTEFFLVFIIICLPIILFWKYLNGSTNFVLGDIASDNIFQTYPQMVHIASRIASGEYDFGYSFMNGLGSAEGPIVLGLANWFCLFGVDKVAYLSGVSIVIKIIASGVLMYLWTKEIGITGIKAMILVLGYEFNAMLITRAAWISYPNVAILVALNLYLAERLLNNICIFNFLFLYSSLFISYSELGTFYSIEYGAMLLIYLVIRLIYIKHLNIRRVLCVIGGFLCAAGIFVLSKLGSVFSSERFSGNLNNWLSLLPKWYEGIEISYLEEAFERTVGQSIGGIFIDYIGSNNLLGGPALYCGILLFLLVPVAFYNLDRVQKCFFGFLYAFSILYLCVPVVNIAFNGFAFNEMGYKLTSYWISLANLFCVTIFLYNIERGRIKSKSIWVFNGTIIIYTVIMLLILWDEKVARISDFWISMSLIMLYAIIINIYGKTRNEKAAYLMLLLLCVETITVSWNVVNDRETFSDDQLEAFFDNGTKSITEKDKSWYRIESYYPINICFCGALVGEYNGLEDYIGGLGLSSGVLDFYRSFGLPESYGVYQMGTSANIYANALLGVKYSALEDRPKIEYGLEKNKEIGDGIYTNSLSLPLAYVYNEQIDADDFEHMTIQERNRAVLQGVLLDEKREDISCIGENDLSNLKVLDSRNIDLNESGGVITLPASPNTVYVLQAEVYNIDDLPDTTTIYYTNEMNEEKPIYYEVMSPVEICPDSDIQLRYDYWVLEHIKYLNVRKYNAEEYYHTITESINKLQDNGMKFASYDRHKIVGSISSEYDGVMATSIPWDTTWKVSIDGENVDTFKVNKGFLGTMITKGEHTLVFEYPEISWFKSVKKDIYKRLYFIVLAVLAVIIGLNESINANKWRFVGRKVV